MLQWSFDVKRESAIRFDDIAKCLELCDADGADRADPFSCEEEPPMTKVISGPHPSRTLRWVGCKPSSSHEALALTFALALAVASGWSGASAPRLTRREVATALPKKWGSRRASLLVGV